MSLAPEKPPPLSVSFDLSPINTSRNRSLMSRDLNNTARANSFARSPKRMNRSMHGHRTPPPQGGGAENSYVKGMSDEDTLKYIAQLEDGE